MKLPQYRLLKMWVANRGTKLCAEWKDIVTCDECVFLKVYNRKSIYAVCTKFDLVFKPFGEDTRNCYCAWGELPKAEETEPIGTDCG